MPHILWSTNLLFCFTSRSECKVSVQSDLLTSCSHSRMLHTAWQILISHFAHGGGGGGGGNEAKVPKISLK